MSGLAAAWSDIKEAFFVSAYAEEKDSSDKTVEEPAEEKDDDKDEEKKDDSEDEEEEDEDDDDDDDDDDEVKDPLDELREKYSETVCHEFKHHFDECVARVTHAQEQPGYADLEEKEDCIEEFFHLQHCLNEHIAPILFNKLK